MKVRRWWKLFSCDVKLFRGRGPSTLVIYWLFTQRLLRCPLSTFTLAAEDKRMSVDSCNWSDWSYEAVFTFTSPQWWLMEVPSEVEDLRFGKRLGLIFNCFICHLRLFLSHFIRTAFLQGAHTLPYTIYTIYTDVQGTQWLRRAFFVKGSAYLELQTAINHVTPATFVCVIFLPKNWVANYGASLVHYIDWTQERKKESERERETVNLHFFAANLFKVMLHWLWSSLSSRQVYVYIKDKLDPPAEGGLLKGHIDLSNVSPSTLIIKNVTKDMQGTYSCNVKTQKHRSQNEAFLIVILGEYKATQWAMLLSF